MLKSKQKCKTCDFTSSGDCILSRHLKKITSERVFVYNRTTAVARAFCEENSNENFEVASDLKDLSSVSVVCICLPSTDVVAKVCEDLMSILKPGTIIIDSTSGEPNKAIQIATQLKTKGIHYIDAPVSGGPHGAKAGALTVMVGGNNPEILQQSIEFLSNSYGKKVFAVGEVGSAHAVKAFPHGHFPMFFDAEQRQEATRPVIRGRDNRFF